MYTPYCNLLDELIINVSTPASPESSNTVRVRGKETTRHAKRNTVPGIEDHVTQVQLINWNPIPQQSLHVAPDMLNDVEVWSTGRPKVKTEMRNFQTT